MTAAKPDCTGEKFGYLTVLSKGGRSPDNRQLWKLQCRCGNVIERTRGNFVNRRNVSCGCRRRENAFNRAKPDCAGQKFGHLTVLEKTGRSRDNRQLWKLQCDCGVIIERARCNFAIKPNPSCGCQKRLRQIERNQKRAKPDCTGQRFGRLAVLGKGDRVPDNRGSFTQLWKLQCDCGKVIERPRSSFEGKGQISCGCAKVGTNLKNITNQKFGTLTELHYQQIDTAVEDEKRDRLLRAAWILTYRRSLGEEISELHEARYIRKHLRYCSIDVFWKRKIESRGGFLYTVDNKKKQIGDTMTNTISNDYPEIELEGIKNLPINPVSKHLKFRRC